MYRVSFRNSRLFGAVRSAEVPPKSFGWKREPKGLYRAKNSMAIAAVVFYYYHRAFYFPQASAATFPSDKKKQAFFSPRRSVLLWPWCFAMAVASLLSVVFWQVSELQTHPNLHSPVGVGQTTVIPSERVQIWVRLFLYGRYYPSVRLQVWVSLICVVSPYSNGVVHLVAPCGWEFNRSRGRGWESRPL